jgi:hypothetical protein
MPLNGDADRKSLQNTTRFGLLQLKERTMRRMAKLLLLAALVAGNALLAGRTLSADEETWRQCQWQEGPVSGNCTQQCTGFFGSCGTLECEAKPGHEHCEPEPD